MMFGRKIVWILLLLTATVSKAQYIWYEPGSWQEMQLMALDDGVLNSERLILRRADVGVQWPKYIPVPGKRPETGRNFRWQQYFYQDNPETGLWYFGIRDSAKRHHWLWDQPAAFYLWTDARATERSTFIINPILNLGAGSGFGAGFMQNGRGAEVRGNIRGKLAFYSRVVENQSYFPAFVNAYRDSMGVVPGLGWWKNYRNGGTDYLQATGYFNAALIGNAMDQNHLHMSMGHGSFMIGQGYRSLILSNAAAPFAFLRFNTKIGPFRYQNIFGQLNGFSPLLGNTLLPKKYMALHRGSLEFGRQKKFEIGFSEMTIHNRTNGGFDVDYLNPIIFYRAIEANLGSADNTLMALDAHYRFGRFRVYGQFILDEFKLSYIRQGGWWANKYGWQLGLMKRMENKAGSGWVQIEYNAVRPFTYSHYDVLNSYTHYNQPLAHPLGANFREFVLRGYFQPKALPRLRATLTGMLAAQGLDDYANAGRNFGSNPRRDNDSRLTDFGVNMLQGNKSNIRSARLDISYMVKHNLNLYLTVLHRNQTGWKAASGNWVSVGLRLNFDQTTPIF